MTAPILAAAIFCIAVTVVQLTSIAIAIGRFRRSARRTPPPSLPVGDPVSIVRPLCGIDNYAADTLSSTFELDYPHYEILFCVAAAKDPVVPLVTTLMAEHPGASARLLVGDDRVSPNPKLNNVVKGWRAARHEWIIIADSNVLMPRDYIQRLFASWRMIPGSSPRRRSAAGRTAFGPKSNARSSTPTRRAGNISSTRSASVSPKAKPCCGGAPISMPPAASRRSAKKSPKMPRRPKWCASAGLKVRLVDRPLAQPLGRRSAAEVWNRQLRWARLRRASFLLYFLPEILSGGVLPMIAVAFLAVALGLPLALCVAGFAALWYGAEMALAAAAGWHVSPLSPLYGLMRDLLLPALFVSALRGNDFVWRGNEMQVERMQLSSGA